MKKVLSILFCLITQFTISQTFQEIDRFNRVGTEISYGDNGYYFKDTRVILISLRALVSGNIPETILSYNYDLEKRLLLRILLMNPIKKML